MGTGSADESGWWQSSWLSGAGVIARFKFQPGIGNLIVQRLAASQTVALSAQFTGGKECFPSGQFPAWFWNGPVQFQTCLFSLSTIQ